MQVYVRGQQQQDNQKGGPMMGGKAMMITMPNQLPSSVCPPSRVEGIRGPHAMSNPTSCPSMLSGGTQPPTSDASGPTSHDVQHQGLEDVPSCASDFPQRLGCALTFLCSKTSATSSSASSSSSSGQQLSEMTALFAGSATPSIDVGAFCKRLQKYLRCSNEAWVRAFVYIDRAASANWHAQRSLEYKMKHSTEQVVTGTTGPVVLGEKTVHRLLLGALVCGLKMQDDVYYTNSYYAKVGGVSPREMNELESGLLKALDWDINVSTEEYLRYMHVVSQTSDAMMVVGQSKETTSPADPAMSCA